MPHASAKWPNFFIVGAVRARTTSLYESFYREDAIQLERIIGRSLPWFHARRAAQS